MASFLKTLVDFMEPTALVWLALLVLIVAHARQRQWRLLAFSSAVWLMLTIVTVLPTGHWLLWQLESAWPPVELATMPECDAVVVLGGGVEPSKLEPAKIHMRIGADRLFTGLGVANAGKGKRLIVSGGVYPSDEGGYVLEADGVRDWVLQQRLTTVPVESLGGCADTHDEAVRVAKLVQQHGWKRVALVTSAFHMRRSVAVFEKAGVPVLAVPCSYQSSKARGRTENWLTVPNATNMLHLECWMHEVIGFWAYRLRGWI